MSGADIQQDTLFSTVIPEERVPPDHPLRPIREMVNTALKELDADFNALYSELGRDSIAPEKLLRAQLLMAFYTIRSERQLMEQINYNLLFRWFVGFSMDDKVWNHSVFTKNRDRLLEGDVPDPAGDGGVVEVGVRVVEDEDLVDPIPDILGDAIEDLTQRLHRVVGDDEDRDLLARLGPDDGEFFGGRPADRVGHIKQWYLARMGLAM